MHLNDVGIQRIHNRKTSSFNVHQGMFWLIERNEEENQYFSVLSQLS